MRFFLYLNNRSQYVKYVPDQVTPQVYRNPARDEGMLSPNF